MGVSQLSQVHGRSFNDCINRGISIVVQYLLSMDICTYIHFCIKHTYTIKDQNTLQISIFNKKCIVYQLDSIIQDGIQNKEKIQETMNNTLQVMQNLTSSKNEINSGDLSSSLDILEKIVNVTNSTQSIIEKKVIYHFLFNYFIS